MCDAEMKWDEHRARLEKQIQMLEDTISELQDALADGNIN
jgi:hypothetical protein